MITLYIKSTYDKIHLHNSKEHTIKLLANSYNSSTTEKLYELTSKSWNEEDLINYWENKGTIISKIDAHILGKQLQPDRQIEGIDGMEDYKFSLFEIDTPEEILLQQQKQREEEKSDYIEEGIEKAKKTMISIVGKCVDWLEEVGYCPDMTESIKEMKAFQKKCKQQVADYKSDGDPTNLITFISSANDPWLDMTVTIYNKTIRELIIEELTL